TGNLAALPETLHHLIQIGVCQAVAVIGEKHVFPPHQVSDRPQTLADVPPDSGVDERDPPILVRLAQQFHLSAGYDAIRESVWPIVEEEFLDDIRLVSKAKNEVAMAVSAVILHHVPQNRLIADRDHRLWRVLSILTDAGTEPAAEEYNFHDGNPSGSISVTRGIGTTKRPPQRPIRRMSRTISSLMFHGRIRT